MAVVGTLAGAMGCYLSHGDPDDDGGGGSSTDDGCAPLACPADMVPVPCGSFVMGSDPGEGEPDEQPEHVVWLSSFCIDRTEVTGADWDECVRDGVCARRCDGIFCGGEDAPVRNYVTHGAAADYCRWTGKRLPTEAEWEKAARGGCEIAAPEGCGPEDERTYPWGDAPPTAELACYSDWPYGGPTECLDPLDVGMRPAGAGPYGTLDMAGNAAEWVADRYETDYYSACASGCVDPTGPTSGSRWVVRGGGAGEGHDFLRVSRRTPLSAAAGSGFRCAYAPERP
jgi:formylglycine-generating enzyme required for sulfatase activity